MNRPMSDGDYSYDPNDHPDNYDRYTEGDYEMDQQQGPSKGVNYRKDIRTGPSDAEDDAVRAAFDRAFEHDPDVTEIYLKHNDDETFTQINHDGSMWSPEVMLGTMGVIGAVGSGDRVKGALSQGVDRRKVAKYGVIGALSVGLALRSVRKAMAACQWIYQYPGCGANTSCWYTGSSYYTYYAYRCSCSGVPSGCTAGTWKYVKQWCGCQ